MSERYRRIDAIKKKWQEDPRWKEVKRRYTATDVDNLRSSMQIQYTVAVKDQKKYGIY